MAWSQLPEDVFGVIVQKLSVDDTLSVCLTCKSWNDGADASIQKLRPRTLRTDVIARRFTNLQQLDASACLVPETDSAEGVECLLRLGPLALRELDISVDPGAALGRSPFALPLSEACLLHLTALTALVRLDVSGQAAFCSVLSKAAARPSAPWSSFLGGLRSLAMRGIPEALSGGAAAALLQCTRLTALDLKSSAPADVCTLASVGLFTALTTLQVLDLGNCQRTCGSGMAAPQDAPPGARLTGEERANVLAPPRLPRLLELRTSAATLAPAAAASLQRLSALTLLDLTACKFPGGADAFVGALSGLAALRELRLRATDVTGTGLEALQSLSHLAALDLSLTHLLRLEPVLRLLLAARRLSRLDLSESALADDPGEGARAPPARPAAPALRDIGSAAAAASDRSPRPAHDAPGLVLPLRRLNLAGAPGGLLLLERLSAAAHVPLEALDASRCVLLSAKALLFLRGCTSLRSLDLSQTTKSVSPPQETGVVAALPHLTLLTELRFGQGHAAAEALAFFLPRFSALRVLSLHNVAPYSNLAKQVTAALPALQQLTSLDISRATLSPDCPDNVAAVRRLHALSASASNLDADALSRLGALTALQLLDVRGCPVDDAAAGALCALRGLTELRLCGTAVSDRTLEALPALEHLRSLSVVQDGGRRGAGHGQGATLAGVLALAGCERLQCLVVSRRLADAYEVHVRTAPRGARLLPPWVHVKGRSLGPLL